MPLFFLISPSLFLDVHLCYISPSHCSVCFFFIFCFAFFPNHFSTLEYHSQFWFWACYQKKKKKKWKLTWFTTCYVRHLITFKYLGQFSWRKDLKNGSFAFHFHKDRSVNRVPTERLWCKFTATIRHWKIHWNCCQWKKSLGNQVSGAHRGLLDYCDRLFFLLLYSQKRNKVSLEHIYKHKETSGGPGIDSGCMQWQILYKADLWYIVYDEWIDDPVTRQPKQVYSLCRKCLTITFYSNWERNIIAI